MICELNTPIKLLGYNQHYIPIFSLDLKKGDKLYFNDGVLSMINYQFEYNKVSSWYWKSITCERLKIIDEMNTYPVIMNTGFAPYLLDKMMTDITKVVYRDISINSLLGG